MATYDYSIYDPQVGQSDYPTKISNLITQLGTDITAESNALDAVESKTTHITVTQAVNLDTMESTIATNTNNIADIKSTTSNNVLLGNDNGAGQDFQELTATQAITLLNGGSGLTLSTTGNAATATIATDAVTLQTPRNINGVAFDGSANVNVPGYIGSINPTDTTMFPVLVGTNSTGAKTHSTDAGLTYNSSTNTLQSGILRVVEVEETAVSVTTGATMNLDPADGTYFYLSAAFSGGSARTFTFGTPAASGLVTTMTLELNNAADASSITWPTGVKWASTVEPTWTSGFDIVTFITRDNGTAWRAFPGGFNFPA
jgi:hypothetical protein